tara:strand:- start:2638 stop:3570 length:933 start_codon:yes stop_codon:yes gene_type:complete
LYSHAQQRAPLQVTNQNPLVRIFGLPAAESAKILESGQETSHISLDWASNFTFEARPDEQIYIDGESAQIDIRWRYGFDLWEFGVDVNYSRYSGGFLDSTIENWHDWFNLPNGGRETALRNQVRYEYSRDAIQHLSISTGHSGFGDTRLTAAYQIKTESRFDMALRGGVKIPTGESDTLLGSGGTDLNIAYLLGDDFSLSKYRASYILSAGMLYTEAGDVLASNREKVVFYSNASFIKDIAERWQLKLQLDGHSKFYKSNLPQLGEALQFSIGGSYTINQDLKIDFAFAEDIITDSSSDINFHLSLYNYF